MGTSQPQTTNLRLDSWKEIAAFLGRDEQTVQRWEKDRALPVHRFPGSEDGRVYAYTEELSRWRETLAAISAGVRRNARTDFRPELRPRLQLDAAYIEAGPLESELMPEDEPEVFRSSGNSTGGFNLKLAGWAAGGLIFCAVLVAAAVHHESAPSAPASSGAVALPEPATATYAHRPLPEAEELYLEGRYYWNLRTPESLNTALDYFTQATAKDPNYADAYVGMADCYNLLREYTIMPASEAFPRAIVAARRAVELDDNSAPAHAALAFVTFYGDWKAAEAERHFQRAIALNPNYAIAHQWYATFLMTEGRFPESQAEIERAQQLDPASPSVLADKGLIMFLAGQPQPGIELLQQLEDADPGFLSPHRYLADLYLVNGRDREFLQEAGKSATLAHDGLALEVVQAGKRGFAAGGERAMLQEMLQVQKQQHGQNRISAYRLARTSALLGEQQDALAYLRESYAAHEGEFIFLRNDATLRSLHHDGPFRDLVTKAGLPALN